MSPVIPHRTPTGGRRLVATTLLLAALVAGGCGPRGERADRAAAPLPSNQAATPQEQPPSAAAAAGSAAQPSPATVAGDQAVGAAPIPSAAPGAVTPTSRRADGKASAPVGASNAPATPKAAASNGAGPAGGPRSNGSTSAAGATPAPGAPQPQAPSGSNRHTGPANLSPIGVGSICECSGPVGASLGGGIAAAQVVTRYINDNGGLNGHPIKLFVGDSNSDPNRYFALVKEMVERDGVLAFMGQMSPLTVNAGDAYLRQKGIPVVGGDGAHGIWFESPVLFYAGGSYRTMAVADAKYAVALKKPKIGVIYCAEAQPCQIYDEALKGPLMAKAPGAEIVYEAQRSLAQPDYTAECLQAKGRGADTLFVILDSAAVSRATRSCSQQGYNPQYITSPLTFTQATADDPNNDGMLAAVATFPWFTSDTPPQQAYQAAVQKYKPNLQHSATTSTVWLAGQMLLEATKNLPAENPTSQGIMKGVWAIRNTDFGGLASAPVSFPEGKPSLDVPCYFVLQIRKGKFVAPDGSRPACL